jgi:hypothetical protein
MKLATKGCTIKYRPWIIAYTEEVNSKKREDLEKMKKHCPFPDNVFSIA